MKKEFAVFAILMLAVLGNYAMSTVPAVSSFDASAFMIFILVLGLLIYSDRKSVKIESFVLMRRTQKGKQLIDKIANNNRTFWSVAGYVGIIIAVLAMVFGTIYLISQAALILEGGAQGGVKILLPGPVASPQDLPGVFVVPWWIWVIGIAAVLFPHEGMHGIMCRVDKVRIKSVGWLLFLIIPGAFVEPDEKHLQKAKRATKMKVYAAGSFANIATSVIVFVLLSAIFAVSFAPAGIYVEPLDTGPASQVNMTGTITDIDGHAVRTQGELHDVLMQYNEGDTVHVKVAGGDRMAASFGLAEMFAPRPIVIANASEQKEYTLTLARNDDTGKGFLGVSATLQSYYYSGGDFAVYQSVISLLLWIFIFSLGIGIVNILPIKPLDGGLLFEEIAGKFTKNPKPVVRIVSYAMAVVLLFNLLGPIFLK